MSACRVIDRVQVQRPVPCPPIPVPCIPQVSAIIGSNILLDQFNIDPFLSKKLICKYYAWRYSVNRIQYIEGTRVQVAGYLVQ